MKTKIALVDNGSLLPEASLQLRAIAKRLGERIGKEVDAVSMAHSDKIDPACLGGRQAILWKDYIARAMADGPTEFTVVPLFFGPSRAIGSSLRLQFESKAAKSTGQTLRVCGTLVSPDDPSDMSLAKIAAEQVIKKLDTVPTESPLPVVLVDHGSPNRQVSRCRDLVAKQLASLLGDRATSVTAASMERREGEEYAFNEPLLESVLDGNTFGEALTICLSMMFLLPGRHAGEGGDIDEIVAGSAWVRKGNAVVKTALIGESEKLIELLARRYAEFRD